MDLATGDIRLGDKPALIVVDMNLAFTTPESPLGGDYKEVIKANQQLLAIFRNIQMPIFFTTVVYDDISQAAVFRTRIPDLNMLERGSKWVDIDPLLEVQANEPIIEKHWPSGFFKTNLHKQLAALKVDSLVITGLTTSGCVRATAVDGLQYDYRVFVIPEACGDRNREAGLANLHDINAKYGRVIGLEDISRLLTTRIPKT